MLIDFRERRREGGRERERNTDVREKHQFVAYSIYPDWGWNLKPRCMLTWI